VKKRSFAPELLFLSASLILAALLAIAGGRLGTLPSDRDTGSSSLDFHLATLDGPELGPSDFEGQVVVIDFWATWCIPCRFQEQILTDLHPELEKMGVQVLSVDLGEQESTVREHYAEGLPPWPVLLDTEDRLTAELGIEALPALMILDAKGEVVYFEVGILDAKALELEVDRAGSS
jgi:thiol-disulfide isomerase/thioredoxin